MKVRGDSEGVCVASNLRNVAQAMAPRVAAAIAGRRIVLVQAPVEYAPAELVEAAMEVLHAPEGFRRFRVPEGTQGMLDAIGAGFPVLVELGSMEVADIAAIGDAVEERALHDLQAPVVVAAACDELPPLIERFPFEVFLDHLALVATPVEVSAVHPELGEMDARLHAVMHLTGGVPALVAVAGVTRPAYSEDLIRACGPWVERFYDEICADPVLLAHMWMPRASDHTLTTVASEVVGRPVTEQMLRDCRDNPLFTLAGPHNLCLPEAFAVAFQRTMRQRNRERVQSLERSLATVVRRTDKLRALDRVRLLGSWGDWEGVDRILGRSLHVLATQSPLQRAVWAESWPAVVPRRLPYLARARQFVESDWPRGAVPMAAVRVWHELTYLLRSEDAPPADSLLDRARKRFADALGRSTAGLEALRAEVGSMCDWLGNELHRHEDQGRRMRPDDVALLLALLVGVADTGIVVGEMTVSQVCVRRGLRLSRTGLRPDELPVMVPELLARGAFLAARSGLGAVAESYLAEYDELVERLGPRDLETERLASIAARHVLTIEAVLADPTVRLVDPEQPFAAHEAVSEAYRAFLVNGQAAGLEWVRSFLTRASW